MRGLRIGSNLTIDGHHKGVGLDAMVVVPGDEEELLHLVPCGVGVHHKVLLFIAATFLRYFLVVVKNHLDARPAHVELGQAKRHGLKNDCKRLREGCARGMVECDWVSIMEKLGNTLGA